jgi:YVTN family beta-propeller protein
MKKFIMVSLFFLVCIFLAACGTASDNQLKDTTTEAEKSTQSAKDESEEKKATIIYTAELDAITKVDATSNKTIKTIEVEGSVHNVQISPDGKTLVATLNAENSLVIIDLATDKVEKVQVGEGPAQVYIQSDGKYAFVANQGTPEKPSDSVSKIDLAKKK